MAEHSRQAMVSATYPCPVCRAPADLGAGCSGCGRPPDPVAAEVILAAARIAELEREEHRRWRGLAEVRQQLRTERSRRDALAAQVRAARGAPGPVSPVPRAVPGTVPPPPVPATRPGPELASRSVQTVLFVSGGWLLGIGAVVFVLVGWGRYGLVGQAVTLAAATVIGLAAPALARWRRLPGTAETLAVIGMLVLLLDGYAAWQAGLVSAIAGSTWAGVVLAGTALVSFGYARLSGLASLRYVALVLAQGAVPLLAATLVGRLDGLAAQSLGVAALALLMAVGNLAVVGGLRRASTPRSAASEMPRSAASEILLGLGWLLLVVWSLLCGGLAGLVLVLPTVGTAAVATLLLFGLVVVLRGTARVVANTGWRQVVAAAAVLLPALAGARLAAVAAPESAQLAAVAVVAGAAVATAAEQGWLARVLGPRQGRWVGGLIALGLLGQVLLGQALGVLGSAGSALRMANDPTGTGLAVVGGGEYLWRLPVSVVMVAVAFGWLLWQWPLARALTAVAAVALAAAAAAPQLGAVLIGPYSWLFQGWGSAPGGTGLFAGGGSVRSGPAALGMVLLAGLTVAGGWGVTRRWRVGVAVGALVGGLALLVALDWAQVPWPVLPVVSLVGGAAVLVAAARWRSGWWTLVGLSYGGALAGAGLAGSLPTAWSTVAALGVLTATAVLVAATARRQQLRVTGWAAAAVTGAALVVAACRAGELSWPSAGAAALVVAGVVLMASTLRGPGTPAAVVGEVAAHAVAVVALLLAVGSPPTLAVLAALWGVAIGLRALRPMEPTGARVARAVAAAGCQLLAWWVLVVYWQVTTVEAFTLPVATIALLLGYLARRRQPAGSTGFGSWLAYGPALAVAALPSLAVTLVDPAQGRRLLLGLAAIAVLLAGVRWRLQAPVVVGVTVAILAALRELALVWQRLDAWVPLTVAGTLLLLLAATYERRRRDLARAAAALRQLG